MTIKELSKYHSIKIEVEQIKIQIKEVEETIIGSSKIKDVVTSTLTTSNPTEKVSLKMAKLRDKLISKQEELIDEAHKIEDYISTVDDEEVRIIVRERFLNCSTWEQIAKKLITDRSTPYYKLKNYLKERKDLDVKDKTNI